LERTDRCHGQQQIDSISCPSSSFCAVIDQSGEMLTYNGSAWSAPIPLGIGDSGQISCAGPSFCGIDSERGVAILVGQKLGNPVAVVTHDFGNGEGGGGGLSCPTQGFCMATGDTNAIAFTNNHWNKPVEVDRHGALCFVSCASSSFCVALDNSGHAYAYTYTPTLVSRRGAQPYCPRGSDGRPGGHNHGRATKATAAAT
jgi:hypothetical protein